MWAEVSPHGTNIWAEVLSHHPMGSCTVPWDKSLSRYIVPWVAAVSHGTNICAGVLSHGHQQCPMGPISGPLVCPMGSSGVPIPVLGYCPMGLGSVPWDQYPDPLFVPWAPAVSHGTNIRTPCLSHGLKRCPMGPIPVLGYCPMGLGSVPWLDIITHGLEDRSMGQYPT